MDWGHMNWGWGGGLMMILWIVVIALIIFFLVRYLREYAPGKGGQETALDVLKKRYARGEISKEEFEEKKRDLM
ncbi:MAG: SHOCT domain-containing protein [Chitinispirillaceae bacterium]